MKYFFLTDGWTVGRVWASDGLWNETAWRRRPDIQRMNVCIVEASEKLWLYRVEDDVLTVEIKPIASAQLDEVSAPFFANSQRQSTGDSNAQAIGQVVLKRLIAAEEVLERLGEAQAMCQMKNIHSVVR